MNNRRRLLLGALVVALSACDHRMFSIEVPPQMVMVDQLAVNLAVLFDDSLTGYLYDDNTQRQGLRQITASDAQVTMFQRALSALFADIQVVTDATALPNETEALLSISRTDFQFSTPDQSYTNSCEVWLSYELAISTPTGEPIDTIKLSAYGSASVAGGKSYPYYVRLALNRAIRDAGARLIAELPKNPKIIHIVEPYNNEAGS